MPSVLTISFPCICIRDIYKENPIILKYFLSIHVAKYDQTANLVIKISHHHRLFLKFHNRMTLFEASGRNVQAMYNNYGAVIQTEFSIPAEHGWVRKALSRLRTQ